ncbi:MAG: hypothetical protein ACI863_001205, partial [Flavobacteriales bacterium]
VVLTLSPLQAITEAATTNIKINFFIFSSFVNYKNTGFYKNLHSIFRINN